MKQSENYKNITESTPPLLDRMETEDTIPTKHDSQNISSTMGPKQTYKTNKIMQQNSKYQSSKPLHQQKS